MSNFFKTLSLISLGILIAIGVIHGPAFILNASATLPAEAVLPLVNESDLLFGEITSSNRITTPVPYALPETNINTTNANSHVGPVQMDLNGDGLSDLVYSYTNHSNYTFQYVLLNNGQGFSKAYVCQRQFGLYAQSYRGDCADPNNAY